MMSFMEWIEFNRKKNIKDKNNVRSNSEPNQQNRTIDHKTETTRDNKTIYTTVVHDFTKSDWKDYRGGN
jgi:hypothetical protein